MKHLDVQTWYTGAWEHYQDELDLLNLRIARQMALMRVQEKLEDPLDAFKGVVLTEDDMQQLLQPPEPDRAAAEEAGELLRQEQELEAEMARKLAAARQQGVELPLIALAELFHLNAFQQKCVMLAFAIELDRKYERLFAYLQDDVTCKLPTADLALRLFCAGERERFEASLHFAEPEPLAGQILRNVVSPEYPKSGLSRILQLDDRIIAYLKGLHQPDDRLLHFTSLCTATELSSAPLPFQSQEHRLTAFLSFCQYRSQTSSAVIKLCGREGSGKTYYLKQYCRELGKPLLLVHTARMASVDTSWSDSIDGVLREARLLGAVVGFAGCDLLFQEEAKFRHMLELLLERLSGLPGLHFMLLHGSLATLVRTSVDVSDWELAQPNAEERLEIWQRLLAESGLPCDVNPAGIAAKFEFNAGQIQDSLHTARQLLQQRNAVILDSALLQEACYRQTRHKLAELTVQLKPKYGWPDLILAPAQKDLLRDACNQYKYRNIVYGDWGFGDKIAYGRGISMLFAGPPGTGKTMSAQVVAKDLGLELYKIDLSQIVSKYIGETEKNLHQIFSQARMTSAILFFDEADSLFGKRSEINNAHDKYANIETAYLLQKMEEYDGVTILATNFAQNLDDAFNRRINFIVRFPFPDEEHRELIWRRFFPADAPLHKDIDFAYLGRTFEVAGGIIKNIVVAAAFLAAREQTPIAMRHLITALMQEYAKLGKIVPREDVEPFISIRG